MKMNEYEERFQQLEEITKKLDQENLSLEESVAYYEQGMNLYKELKEWLETTKGRIYQIETSSGELTPWEATDELP